MQTTINNNHRVFLIQSQGFMGSRDIFCNIEDIEKVLKENFEPNEEFKILYYFNRKFKRCTKKFINEQFYINKIEFRIN